MELTPDEIAALRVSDFSPGRCRNTTRTVRAMHPKVVVLATMPATERPFRCFMGVGHGPPCCAWGPDGAPWVFEVAP